MHTLLSCVESRPMSTRRTILLDAAITVLGREGPKGLTHRATDRKAGLPEGTTANYFGRRRELLDAIIERLGKHDRDHWEQTWAGQRASSAEELAAHFSQMIRESSKPPQADLVRARLYLHLEAPEAIEASNRTVTRHLADHLATVGADPHSVELLMSTIDGLLLRAVTSGSSHLPDHTAITAALLRAMRADANQTQ